ncbi:tape measure protein [Neorhizobium galegae]|uniref:tape measure protein n=1 Tax=Neorhizobium galegae TaxID=399 RepID=UPI002102C3ED|nr:tape measure protein [Neorhizobium galegae]MCQ1778239.1 tape measure protein [Neorhizobium galegae]MCQ1796787.1 tape measure protein [Neorhizobium galegae]
MIIEQLVAALGFDLTGESDLRRFNAGLDNAQRKLAGFAAAAVRVGAVAATAMAGGMAALGKSVVGVSAQFESYQATLETIEGSSAKARASLDWISDFAKRTPFEVAELTEAFVRLRAYGLDPTNGLMASLGDASSAMGKSLMSAVEMVADASTGEFERLKEFGIRASQAGDQVTFSWTQNGKATSRTVKKTGEEITKFIKEQFGQRFSGAMIRQSKTWNGMMSNLGDVWTDFERRIGDAGFFDAVKGQLDRLLNYIGKLDADGTIDRWSRTLSDALTTGVNVAVFALDRLHRHFKFLTGWVDANSEWWGPIKAGLLAIGAYIFPRTAALLVLEDILSWMQGSDSVIGSFAESLAQLTGIDVDTLGMILATLAGAASLAVAAGGITAITAPIRALAGALRLLGGGRAAGGLAVLGRLGAIGAAGAGAVELGSQVRSGDTAYSRGLALIPGPEDALSWLYKKFSGASNPSAPGPYADDAEAARRASASANVFQGIQDRINNAQAHISNMNGGMPAGGAVTDNRQDNRDMSVNPTITINQTVQQATQAPGAAASATAGAVSGAVQSGLPPTRTVQSGAF